MPPENLCISTDCLTNRSIGLARCLRFRGIISFAQANRPGQLHYICNKVSQASNDFVAEKKHGSATHDGVDTLKSLNKRCWRRFCVSTGN